MIYTEKGLWKQEVQLAMDSFRKNCLVGGEEYWDLLSLLESETSIDTTFLDWTPHRISLRTKDGICIDLKKMVVFHTYINGYVSIPSTFPSVKDLFGKTHYDEFQEHLGICNVEITFADREKIGWDHNHVYDAHLDKSLDQQHPEVIISGPVQVFLEAMEVIRLIKEHEIQCQRMKKKKQVDRFVEELMRKVWNPSNVSRWIKAGMDL